jgi:hypothetical protein
MNAHQDETTVTETAEPQNNNKTSALALEEVA